MKQFIFAVQRNRYWDWIRPTKTDISIESSARVRAKKKYCCTSNTNVHIGNMFSSSFFFFFCWIKLENGNKCNLFIFPIQTKWITNKNRKEMRTMYRYICMYVRYTSESIKLIRNLHLFFRCLLSYTYAYTYIRNNETNNCKTTISHQQKSISRCKLRRKRTRIK